MREKDLMLNPFKSWGYCNWIMFSLKNYVQEKMEKKEVDKILMQKENSRIATDEIDVDVIEIRALSFIRAGGNIFSSSKSALLFCWTWAKWCRRMFVFTYFYRNPPSNRLLEGFNLLYVMWCVLKFSLSHFLTLTGLRRSTKVKWKSLFLSKKFSSSIWQVCEHENENIKEWKLCNYLLIEVFKKSFTLFIDINLIL